MIAHLGGVHVEGGAIAPGYESFVGLVSCPNWHGMTAGEIARWRRKVEDLDLELAVIGMRGWQREMRAIYGRAARLAAEALEQPVPPGGTFLFFDTRPFMRAGETLPDVLERCLEAGVMLTPGTACGTDFGSWARLCFTTLPEPELVEALALLRKVLVTRA